jgi:tripartite-type tricarboxylate transporter receptor subunit TctC
MKIRFAIAFILAAFAGAAAAQGYPTRAITLVVPFSAGGPTDTIARLLAQRMATPLGQSVVVENVTGAGGSIGVGKVARSAPDGYTLSIGHVGTHVINGAVHQLPYDLLKDLEPVAMVATNPQLIVSRNTLPAKNLKELIAWTQANEDKASMGTGGAGTPAHVSSVYYQNATHSKIQIIHYRGAAPAMQDLLAGHIDMLFDQAVQSIPQVRAGRIRAYAVTSKTRLAAAPDIPTVDEAGLPGLYMSIWHAIWVPKDTPRAIVMKLNAAIVEALAAPAVRQKLAELGQEIPPREQQTPEALGAHHRAEIERWWPVIKAADIKAD